MERWSRQWAADWNGRGTPLADAIAAAEGEFDWPSRTQFDSWLTWYGRGGQIRATYAKVDEIRERLATSAPPSEAWLRLYAPAARQPTYDADLVTIWGAPEPTSDLEVWVRIDRTQVTVGAEGDNPFTAKSAFDSARNVIDRKAVTRVPYHLRRRATGPAEPTRWTRILGWIEQHPGTVGLIGVVATLIVAIIGLIVGG